ncbi:MAG: fibronectin type III domain-containing protein [Ruminococcus sp.]|nr:fibronectin type III domain-containing protein [Ruminococcus sp.]
MRKFRAIISVLLALVLVVSVITIAVVSTGVVSAASAAPSLSLSNKYNGIRGEWTAVSGASHYIVYFRRASETQWSSDIAYSNYYPLLNTEPGTLYCMQVQGVAADGTRGSYSRVKSLTFIPRAEIKNLYYNTGNRLVWDAVEGANRYMIARKTSVDSTYTYYTTEQTSFTEMSIVPEITYTYQVRAAYATEHNGTAYGAWSTSRSVSASAKPELTVSNKTGGVDVNWEPVAGATRYTLYYKETGTADWSSLELRDTGYLFMELTPGVNYSFQLRALNGLSNPFSAVSKITYVPQFQTEVSLSNQTSSRSILAEWAPVTGATQYTVYFKSASSASWRSVTTDENEIVLTNANQGTLYSVQVRPLFSGTPGLYSKVASIVYTAVTDEKPVVTAANSDDGINVSWTRVSGASSYILYYKLTGEAEWQSFETEDNEILVTQPVGGSQYSFQVQPVFGTTTGAYSRVVSIVYRTDKAPVLSLSVSNGWITLSWTDVAGVGSYRVEYWNSSDPSKVSSREIGDRSAVLKRVTKGVTYYFRVTPLFAGQAGTASEVQSIMLF